MIRRHLLHQQLCLSLPAVLLFPVATVAAPAQAAGSTGSICAGDVGSMRFSPGLETTAQVQNIVIKGILSECAGSTVTSASYVAHLKTSGEPAPGAKQALRHGLLPTRRPCRSSERQIHH